MIDEKVKEKIKRELSDKYGNENSFRINRGVDQSAPFWLKVDGNEDDFEKFCLENFVGSPNKLDENFEKISTNLEVLGGHFNKIVLDLKRSLHLDLGEILPIDQLFGQFEPSAHFTEDLFNNKIAFFILLNFPYYNLKEKMGLGVKWDRKSWGYARIGDIFTSRVPAEIYQKIGTVLTKAETYIAGYNIYLGKIVDKKFKTFFPLDLKLISHWGLRDELKAKYADPDGLKKQKLIYEVMKRIIMQEIPSNIINCDSLEWDPFDNKVFEDKNEISVIPEPNTRYQHLLNVFNTLKELDPYYPSLPTHVKRKFEAEREIPEETVEKLFTEIISSPEVRNAGKLISNRLKRNLEPFDVWYDGFKPRSSISQEELDKIVGEKYPNINAFEKDIQNIIFKLGFSVEKAEFIAERIEVDPARGSGHAWGAEMKSEKAHLRTRVPKGGMNYKGFNIAMHELGHCVEQTITLQNVDYYLLKGVPNTAFTEAFAFVFQGKDLEILGKTNNGPNVKYLNTLDKLWATYEIIGVSFVDMKVWNWLYNNPKATSEELKNAVISIAKEVWNKYYAEIFGVKDQLILAVYSHMIDAALYLPDYPLGHLIDFQIEKYLEGKNLGKEMERMCIAGRIIPEQWMKNAVGSELSAKPLLEAAAEALKNIK